MARSELRPARPPDRVLRGAAPARAPRGRGPRGRRRAAGARLGAAARGGAARCGGAAPRSSRAGRRPSTSTPAPRGKGTGPHGRKSSLRDRGGELPRPARLVRDQGSLDAPRARSGDGADRGPPPHPGLLHRVPRRPRGGRLHARIPQHVARPRRPARCLPPGAGARGVRDRRLGAPRAPHARARRRAPLDCDGNGPLAAGRGARVAAVSGARAVRAPAAPVDARLLDAPARRGRARSRRGS